MDKGSSGQSHGTQCIARAVALLRMVSAAGTSGVRLVELAAANSLTRGTAHRMLTALAHEDLIVRDASTKSYRLGQEAYVLGSIASAEHGIHHLALPALHRLTEATEDTAFLSLLSGTDFVCVHREEARFPIHTHWLKAGDRHPLGTCSPGQAILAAMSDEAVRRVVKINLETITQRYPHYSVGRVTELVAEARTRGFAVNPGMIWPGAWGIAAAILNARGWPIGALSIGAVEARLRGGRQRKVATLLNREAKWLSQQLSHC